MDNNLKTYLVVVLLMIIFSCNSLNYLEAIEDNISIEQQATQCLEDSKLIMQVLITEGFKVIRINDSIRQAQAVFDSQSIFKENQRKYDFSPVLPYCEEINEIKEQALTSKEDMSVLLKVYNDSITSGMNTSSIDKIIDEIYLEIDSERYEKISNLVDNAYTEISNVKASYTGFNVFYTNTLGGLWGLLRSKNKLFQVENYWVISTIIVLLLAFFLVYRTSIMKTMVRKKIENLKTRKATIKQLMMKVQSDYFQIGKMSENEYNIKIKKFAELIRDIDRQIPLLQEELARLESKKYKYV